MRHGRVLLVHRSPSRRWHPDVWDLPGRHAERGESPLQAFVRELDEELGVQVIEDSCTPIATVAPAGGDGAGELRLSISFVGQWLGEPTNRCPEEHDQLGWFRADEPAALDLAHEKYRPLLGRVIRCD